MNLFICICFIFIFDDVYIDDQEGKVQGSGKSGCIFVSNFSIFSFYIILFFKIYFIFIGKLDIQNGGESGHSGQRERFHLMIHSPTEHNDQCYAYPKPGSRNVFQVSLMGSGS